MRSPAFSRLLLSFWTLQFLLVLSSLAMQFPLLPTLGWGGLVVVLKHEAVDTA
jgi:hypothetical protein